jgi:hypothetical protein
MADEHRPVEAHHSLRQHQLVGEDAAGLELAVAVRVDETEQCMRQVGLLLLHRVVGAGRLGDEQAAVVIERGGNRPLRERRAGDLFDLEPGRQGERLAIQLNLDGVGGRWLRRIGGEQGGAEQYDESVESEHGRPRRGGSAGATVSLARSVS